MNPFAPRGSAELAALLEEQERAGARSAPSAPARAGSPAALAGVAARVADAGDALAPGTAPRPEFRDALRTRLVAVATVQAAQRESAQEARQEAPAPVRRAAWRAPALAGGTAAVVAFSGVAVASEQALPGEALYGLKRTGESLELALARGAADEGTTHLEQASTRLDEVSGLVAARPAALGGGGGPVAAGGTADRALASDLLADVLADMDASTRAGGDDLARAIAGGDLAPRPLFERWAQEQSAQLQDLLPALPAGTRMRASVSLAVVASVAERVLGESALPLGEPAAPPPAVPGATATPVAPAVPQEPAVPGGSAGSAAPSPAPTGARPSPGGEPGTGGSATPPSGPGALLPEPTTSGPALPRPSLPVPPLPAPPLPTSLTPLPVPTLGLPLAPTLSPPLAPLPSPLPTLPLPLPTAPALPLPVPTATGIDLTLPG